MLTHQSFIACLDGKYLYDQQNTPNVKVQLDTKSVNSLATQYALGIEVPHVFIRGLLFTIPLNRTAFPYLQVGSEHYVYAHRVINKPGEDWLITLYHFSNNDAVNALINSVKN